MKKRIAALVALGLVVGSLAGTAEAAKKKKKPKPKAPVAVDVKFLLGHDGEACMFSTTAVPGDGDCGSPFWGLLGDQLEPDALGASAVDGLPLTIDATKPIKGTLVMESYAAVLGPDVVGVGQPSVTITATGTSGDTEVPLGEFTSDPYLVTPNQVPYPVEFEIQIPAEHDKKVLEDLTLTWRVTGPSLFHGAVQPDAASNFFTIGAWQ